MSRPDSEPDRIGPFVKLCGPDEKIMWYSKYASPRIWIGPKEVKAIGSITIEGCSGYSGAHEYVLVLDQNGLTLQPMESVIENSDLFSISLRRTPTEMGEKSLPVVLVTIDGHQIVLFSQMNAGNPDLPEESFDWIATWKTNATETDIEVPLAVCADPRIINLLNFQFQH